MLSTTDNESRITNHESGRGISPQLSALNSQPTRHRLVYILAASHSGSTLLAMLLGAHPEACTVGELKGVRENPGTYRCSCGSPIRECDFWMQVNAAMARRGFDFAVASAGTNVFETKNRTIRRLLQPLHRGRLLELARDTALRLFPEWHSHLRRVQRRNTELVGALLEVSGTRIIIDSSKVGLRLKYLLLNRDLNVQVLRLTRDGRGVALTHTNPAEFADAANPRFRAGGTGGKGFIPLSMHAAARLWRRSNEEADCVTAGLSASQWMEVRYEQLCQSPEETLSSVYKFLGIAPVPVGNDFRERKQQHVVGNGMRFDTTSEIRLDDRWKTHLSTDDLKTFDRVAGDLNRQYGYV